MKQSTHKWLLPGILCMAVLSVFTTTAATKASHKASPESLGTFNYDVRYKNGLINAKVATATITWEESKWQNRPAYHSSALVKAAPVFALFISSDYVAETYFSHSGLAPLYFINPFKGVDEQTYVDINGMKQFITIRGKSKDNPVILYLHGGPLSPDSYVSYLFSNDLIDDYTFVCWDQRGCGRTYPPRKSCWR